MTTRPLCRCTRLGVLTLMGVVASTALSAAEVDIGKLPPPASAPVDFRRDVLPILSERCFSCHKGDDASSGQRLDVRSEILGESNGKPLAKIGDSAGSRLIHLVGGLVPDKVMPAKGARLTAVQVGVLRAWIDQGLKWDDSLLPAPVVQSSHWAFQPVQRPALPKVKNAAWVRTPVDAFIAARHEEKGLTPAPEASRGTLIRRLTLDLTGLPPTPEEIDAFVNDPSPNAYEKLVERLLNSPSYAERWARHWLDLARWADSEGYESDHLRPYAWHYRDYVIRSFKEDRPFDRFLRQQIAGDELLPYADENLMATGFLSAARLSSNEEDRARQRNDVLIDVVNATGSAVLGLTMHCAQCHNHKFDPISARDYYRFQGFFVKGAPNNLALRDPAGWKAYQAAMPPEYEATVRLQQAMFTLARDRLVAAERKKLAPEQLQALDGPVAQRTEKQELMAREAWLKFQFTAGQVEKTIPAEDKKLYEELKKKIEALEKRMPDRPQTFGFYSPVTSPTKVDVLPMKGFYAPPYDPTELARSRPHLLVAGEVHQRGPALDVGWPALFGPVPHEKVEKSPRTALADWLVSPQNPLTARVWVNRVWQQHFGRGIVATPSDFGVRGAKPTHPELIDWLAAELMQRGWSTKHIHRLIVGSATYRQSASVASRTPSSIDPDNLYWWRWSPRRLEVEAIRDSLLAVSGELDRHVGGPSQPDENKTMRRTLYLLQKRQKAPAVQTLFDGPGAANDSCAKRNVSTVPLQALYLLNNDFALGRAKMFAERVQKQAGDDRRQQVGEAFRLALGRLPDAAEHAAAATFFAASPTDGDPSRPLVQFCQALMNVNEFVYID